MCKELTNDEVKIILKDEIQRLYYFTTTIQNMRKNDFTPYCMNRGYLEAMTLEKGLDSMGAQNSCFWRPLRKHAAILKCFCRIDSLLIDINNQISFCDNSAKAIREY